MSKTKETPMLFSTAMVNAILAGNKTQTRRTKGLDVINKIEDKAKSEDEVGRWFIVGLKDGLLWVEDLDTLESFSIECPYGKPGDLIWVREKWTQNGLNYFRYAADWLNGQNETDKCYGTFIGKNIPEKYRGKWKPSIHMPKAACRIWLEITDVRVERLQDISEKDAKAEGAPLAIQSVVRTTAKNKFGTLWISINGQESWNANPYVWVIEFKRCQAPVNS